MLGLNIVAAETDGEARYLFSSLQQSFLNIRSGRPGRLPPPVDNFDAQLDPYARGMLDDALACAIVGGAQTVRQGMAAFVARTEADELMVTANIFDHDKRKRSFAIVAGVGELRSPPPSPGFMRVSARSAPR
jgi:alkanesulfonate monooxygenase SsuD/methylene tetrahydromethanopterin reductase-like flavin-dependent oxidoreductase (luciferase family)